MRKKESKHFSSSKIFYFIFIIILFYLIYYNQEGNVKAMDMSNPKYLDRDGFCVFYDPKYVEIKDQPSEQLKKDVLSILQPGYNFIDYVYKIHDGSLSTFHRDVTSSQTIYKTKHPVYTLILYKYDGYLLSVCPGSAKSYPFVWSRIMNVEGRSGTAILFDCDLLHAGSFNNCNERHIIQYKICHSEDINKLEHLVGIRQEKTAVCQMTLFNIMLRKATYIFELPINYIFYPLMLKRENNNTLIGKIQSIIPVQFYINSI